MIVFDLKPEIFTSEEAWVTTYKKHFAGNLKRCSRCIYDETVPKITFDENGVCNYCHIHDGLEKQYPAGDEGYKIVEQAAEEIKRINKNRDFDIIVGVSGGADSSLLIDLAIKLGMRPLAVHFDNTWDSTTAVENIHAVLDKNNVPLETYVVNNQEYDDLYRSIMEAGVPDLEAPTDIGLARVLNMVAEKYGVKHIYEGHSFRTEGISPLGWLYMDGKYIQSIQKQYGTRKLKTYPNLTLLSMLKSMIIYKTKKVRPLWHINHVKEETKKMLVEKYGWKWYGGHHLENRITNFYHTYFLPRRFGIDMRILGYSALIRSGQMTREQGIELMQEPPKTDHEIVEMVKKRLNLSEQKFVELMTKPRRNFREFKTYKPVFEKYRPFFYIMAKAELIPMSFYIKYTSKNDI